MTDWVEEMNPEEKHAWDEFVEHFRRDTLEQIAGSQAFISLVPKDAGDVKFWVELGAAVMMDKPILAVVAPGAKVTQKMRLICDEIVEADVDTEVGRAAITSALTRMLDKP